MAEPPGLPGRAPVAEHDQMADRVQRLSGPDRAALARLEKHTDVEEDASHEPEVAILVAGLRQSTAAGLDGVVEGPHGNRQPNAPSDAQQEPLEGPAVACVQLWDQGMGSVDSTILNAVTLPNEDVLE